VTKRNPEETRTRLLEAAIAVVTEQGVDAFTLDTVAQVAGVSKGGLLHHFASKEALITDLIAHVMTTFETEMEQALDPQEPPGTPGRWTRAYVRLSFTTDERARDLGVAYTLMVRRSPDLVASVSTSFTRIWEALEHDGLDPVDALLIRSAADGVYYNEVAGNPSLPEPLRTRLLDRLIDMTRISTLIEERGNPA
jgi:AcrR family transcriptional regulator